MAIVSVKLAGIEFENSADYTVGQATALALLASVPYEPVSVEMHGRYPYYDRDQIQPKVIPFTIFFHGDYPDRKTNYDALRTIFDGGGLRNLRWTDDEDSIEWQLKVSMGPLLPSGWLHRAAAELTAWNPVPIAV